MSACLVDDEELCVQHWRYCFISFVWCSSSTTLWDISAVQTDWVCECSCGEDVWYWVYKSDKTQSDLYDMSSIAIKSLCTLS